MSSNLTTKRDYIWNTIGVFAQNLISPLLLVVITRVNGIYDSGIFSFAFSVAIVFWAIAMWGGRTYQVSDIRKEFSSGSYVVVRLALGVVVLISAILFSVLNGYDPTKSTVIILLVVFKIIESSSDAVYGILQSHERLDLVGKSLLYKTIGGFGLFVLIDVLSSDIALASLGIIIANLFVVCVYDLRKMKQVSLVTTIGVFRSFSTSSLVAIIRRCFPAFIVIFLAMFSLNIPRYFIDMYHPDEIGVFGIIAMPVTLVVLFMTFIMQPNTLKLSRLYQSGRYVDFDKTVKAIFTLTLIVGAAILLAAFAVGVPALRVIFGLDFSSYQFALIVIVVGGIFNALVTVFINILVITRNFTSQVIILLSTNAVLVIISAYIVSRYGLYGGVILFTIMNIVQLLLFYVVYRHMLRKRINEKKN